MAKRPVGPCIGTYDPQVRRFLKDFACRLTGAEAIEETIRGIASARGEEWPWVARWVEEEGPEWVNDMDTLVFEVALGTLAGPQALNFAQQVWMLQPTSFGYQPWGERGFVRLWWDRSHSAAPGQVGRY